MCWLPYANFAVQCLLLVGLVCYAVETWKIRKTSQEQVETSQKPCLTLSATARNPQDTILGLGDSNSAQVVFTPEGNLHLINVGLGPAFNVSYSATPEDPQASISRPNGYLIHILLREPATIPVPRGIIRGHAWNFVANYDSLTGRHYETRIRINDLVLTRVIHRLLPV